MKYGQNTPTQARRDVCNDILKYQTITEPHSTTIQRLYLQSLRMVYDYKLHLAIRTPQASLWEQSDNTALFRIRQIFIGYDKECRSENETQVFSEVALLEQQLR